MEVGGVTLGGVASSEGVVPSEDATSSESSAPKEGCVVSGERSLPWELAAGEAVLSVAGDFGETTSAALPVGVSRRLSFDPS